MRRLLLFILLFAGGIWLLRRLAGIFHQARGEKSQSSTGNQIQRRAELVRDRICNTYVPKDSAIAVRELGQVHYFCSEACRDRRAGSAGLADQSFLTSR